MQQSLKKLEAYFAEKDWSTLCSSSPPPHQQRMCVVTDRMWSLGVLRPNEPTVKNMAGLLAAACSFECGAAALHTMAVELNKTSQQMRRWHDTAQSLLTTYPDDPKDQPDACLQCCLP